MGVISPLGVGSDATWQAIQNGHSGVRTVPEWVEANWPIPICGDVVDFEPKQYVKPRKSLKVMSRETQLGFSAAMLAWEESGLADSDRATSMENSISSNGAASECERSFRSGC